MKQTKKHKRSTLPDLIRLMKNRSIVPPVAGFLLYIITALAIALPPVLAQTTPALADAGIMRWETVSTPGSIPGRSLNSISGRYDILSPGGGEVVDYAIGKSGTVAAVVNTPWPSPGGVPTNILLISTDWGLSWSDSSYAIITTQGWGDNQIVHITIAPDNPAAWAMTVADDNVTGPTHVYYNDEAGIHWVDTQLVLAENETIRSVDISPDYGNGARDIGVATATGTGGGSFYVVSTDRWGSWVNQGRLGSVLPLPSGTADYFSIKFSPSYARDFSVALVYATDNATYFNVGFRDTNLNTTNDYAYLAGVEVKNSSSPALASPGLAQLNTACLQLPQDFTGQAATLRRAYISLDVSSATKAVRTSEDGIYRIDDTHTYSLMDTTKTLDKSIYSIAYYGTYAQGKLLAGEHRGYPCNATVPTWFTDSPTVCPIPCWYPALKPATGAAAQGTCTSGTKDGIGACRVAWDEDGTLAFAGTGSLAEQAGLTWWALLYGPPIPNDEAAFAVSRNNGETFNEVGLINTTVDWFNDVAPSIDCSTIYLASVNRNAGQAGVCNEFDSVWRTTMNPKVMGPLPVGPRIGYYWERVLTHTTSDSCRVAQSDKPLLRLPMGCDDTPDGEVVGWAAQLTNTEMWSPDYGDFWATIQERDPIQDFAFETHTILHNLSPAGLVHKLTYSGTEWSTKGKSYDSGVDKAHTIAVFPTGKVLVGAAAGGQDAGSYSSSSGNQWVEIPRNANVIGNVHVAFDSNFSDNKFVYLADDKRDTNGAIIAAGLAGAVFREEVPAYIRLEDADMMTAGNLGHAEVNWPAQVNGLVLTSPPHKVGQFGVVSAKTGDPQPALYTAHDNITTTQGTINSAVCRTLRPWQAMPKPGIGWDCLDVFAPVTQRNIRFTMEPSSLKYCGCCTLDSSTTLYALDNQAGGVFNGGVASPVTSGYTPSTNQGMLWAYVDCLAKRPPVILSPPDGGFIGSDPVTGRNQQIQLSWEQLCIAVKYDIEIFKDSAMTMKVNPAITNPGGVPIITSVTGQMSVELDSNNVTNPKLWISPGALPEAGSSYYWRIRVTRAATGQIATSPWTAIRSFSIKPGFIVTAPVEGIQLLNPKNNCDSCPIQPTALSWTPFKDATKYEVTLAKDPAFTQVIKRATTTTTAYQYADPLEYGKSYYWRVRTTEVDGKSNVGDWSGTFTFRTVPAPPLEPPKNVKQQQQQQQQIGPSYMWIVIVVIIAVPLAMFALIIATRRSSSKF